MKLVHSPGGILINIQSQHKNYKNLIHNDVWSSQTINVQQQITRNKHLGGGKTGREKRGVGK